VNNDERTAAVKAHHDVLGTHLMDFIFADRCFVNNIINNYNVRWVTVIYCD